MPAVRVLLIDKSLEFNRRMTSILANYGCQVDFLSTPEEAYAAVRTPNSYTLIILPLDTSINGSIAIIEDLRCKSPETAIIVTSTSRKAEWRIRLLDAGADVLLMQPYLLKELAAHCRAILRPSVNRMRQQETPLHAGNITVCPDVHQVFVDDTRIQFTNSEFNLLLHLMRRFDRVMIKSRLVDLLFKSFESGSSNAVESIMCRLRRKLESAGASIQIKTEHGIGYVLTNNPR